MRARIADLAAIAAAGALALAQSWQRWCDPVIDIGRDLYIPEQLLHGARLYRDIRYNYPPLTPYLLAFLTSITGHSLNAFTAIGIATSAVVTVLLYVTANRVGGRWSALAIAMAFVSINMCGASTWGANWIFPYTYAATFGMTFFLAFLASIVFERPGLAMGFALPACWCKVEFIAAVAIAIAASLLVRRLRMRDVVGFVIASAVSVAIAIALFGAAPLRANLFPPSLLHTARAERFYSFVSGTAFWRENIISAFLGAAVIALIGLLIQRKQRLGAIAVAVAGGVLVPAAAFFRACGYAQWATLLRRRNAVMFALGAFSIAATLRIAFNVAPVWYGFVLVVPLYLLIAYVIRGEVIWAVLLIVLSFRTLAEEHQKYALKRYAIATKRGVILDGNADRAAVLNEALPMLHGSAAVFPEGLSLNYFARVPTPLTYQTFTPIETADPTIEADIIREMAERRPECVVILSRDVGEFGSRGFGIDYSRSIVAFIRGHYDVERSWTRPRFQLILFKRR